MGTRYFSRVEEKGSRIKWEKADPVICEKLRTAIRHDVSGFERSTVFIPVVIPIGLVAIFLFAAVKMDPPIWFSVPYISAGVLFFLFLLMNRMKALPYLYPEKQQSIWIFRAKCSNVTAFHMSRNSFDGSFSEEIDRFLQNHACFQRGGVHISIPLRDRESSPVGKEYIFYKFNVRCGNRWAAVRADKLMDS